LNVAHLLLACLPVFIIAYLVCGRFIGRIFGEDGQRKTPAHTMEDGKDYVPANPLVLFSHHFASIAGGGPVVGPAVALVFGYGPAVFMIVTTTASLIKLLFDKYIPQRNITLMVADLLLLALSAAFVILAVSLFKKTGEVGHGTRRGEIA
jgi:carbon starvation protein CstA